MLLSPPPHPASISTPATNAPGAASRTKLRRRPWFKLLSGFIFVPVNGEVPLHKGRFRRKDAWGNGPHLPGSLTLRI
ncbi:hypothetical protein PSAC2689_120117 [Paraburkholderia sacchari]